MLPAGFPRFHLQTESTAALRLGWVFFLLLGGLMLWAAWFQVNPEPEESPEEIQYRLRREVNEQLREKGFSGRVPEGEPPPPSPPPPVRWERVFGFLFTGLAAWTMVWWPIHRELRFRAAGEED